VIGLVCNRHCTASIHSRRVHFLLCKVATQLFPNDFVENLFVICYRCIKVNFSKIAIMAEVTIFGLMDFVLLEHSSWTKKLDMGDLHFLSMPYSK